MFYGTPRVKTAFSGVQKKSQSGLSTLLLVFRQLSNHLHFCHVPSPFLLPKLHSTQTIMSVSLPPLKTTWMHLHEGTGLAFYGYYT